MAKPILDSEKLKSLISYACASDCSYVRLSWCDVHGMARGITIPSNVCTEFLEDGFSACAGLILLGPREDIKIDIVKGIDTKYGGFNCYFVPSSPKIYKLSWFSETKEVICEGQWINQATDTKHNVQSKPTTNAEFTTSTNPNTAQLDFNLMPRYIARMQLEKLQNMGYKLYSAFESEFHVLKPDTLEALSNRMEALTFRSVDQHVDFLYDAEKKLREANIQVRAFHSEYSFGMFEFNFMPKYGIETFDDMYIYRQAMKIIAAKHNLKLTFMPRPLAKGEGAGFHFNFSIWDGGQNVLYDSSSSDRLSLIARYWLGGMLKHLPGMTAIACPTVNDYRRIGLLGTPSRCDWGIDNRLVAVRVNNSTPSSTRIEHRMPSAVCNPYLMVAGIVAAGIDGIRNKIEPPEPGMEGERQTIPKTLDEAIQALENDDVIVQALGKQFVDYYCQIKREFEIKPMKDHDMRKIVPEEFKRELEMYLDM